MKSRILPLNLPAQRADEDQIEGNPVSSRLESAVANCFPGLEADIRNLDRRFFPGLIFSFVSNGDDLKTPTGARLIDIDLFDPDIDKASKPSPDPRRTLPELADQILSIASELKAGKAIYLLAVTVGGTRLNFHYESGVPFDWNVSWRIIRSLRPDDEIAVELGVLPNMEHPFPMTLKGRRRVYQNTAGELSEAYKPGELTQSLCSPWQHDFRDCGCTYWASNRPDIVLPSFPATIMESLEAGAAAARSQDPVLWIRWDRTADTPPRPTADACRPFELDHYEINERWKDLPFVLENRERGEVYAISSERKPGRMGTKLRHKLTRLAGIEQALALEYLYARYSVRANDKDLSLDEQEHANFLAHELLVIAISEMTHLRWVNQLLRELYELKYIDLFEPVLDVATRIPPTGRKAESRDLWDAIDSFIDAEAPSGTIDGQYAKLIEFFRAKKYPANIIGLTQKIIDDGVTHYSRFREIKALLDRYGKRLVRPLNNLPLDDPRYGSAILLYDELISALRKVFVDTSNSIDVARAIMLKLDVEMAGLAGSQDTVGVPLLEIALSQQQARKKIQE